jgi:hypothetical protein
MNQVKTDEENVVDNLLHSLLFLDFPAFNIFCQLMYVFSY